MKISKEIVIFTLLIVIFVTIRLFGVDLPYYQDEQKYVARGVLLQGAGVTSGHPPLLGLIMTAAGYLFGAEYFRLMPIIFGTGSLIAFYFLMKTIFDVRVALWSGFLYAISPYGVWSSLMVDVDGAVLPFFAVLAFLFYTLWKKYSERKWLYGILCAIALILGIFTKLSFILVFVAIGADMAIYYWNKGYRKMLYIIIGSVIVLPILALVSVTILNKFLPSFDFNVTLGHATDYFRLSGRNYDQILFQLFKSILYLSPLLVVPIIFLSFKKLAQLRLFVLYLIFSFIFYLIIFDFSSGALDKYLMVFIIPLSALSGAAIANIEWHKSIGWLSAGLATVLFLIFMQNTPHYVPALYPKEEWLGRILNFDWKFLVPFMGGSGPLGFYSSWFFLGMSWTIAIFVSLYSLVRNSVAPAFNFIIVVGVVYCFVMTAGLLFGYPFGSSKKVFNESLVYIGKTSSVKSVITYNDVGAYYLNKIGKYERRMFAAPKYEDLYGEILSNYYGHLLVVDIPRIYKDSVYWKYISLCQPEFVSHSGYISATLYNCQEHSKL